MVQKEGFNGTVTRLGSDNRTQTVLETKTVTRSGNNLWNFRQVVIYFNKNQTCCLPYLGSSTLFPQLHHSLYEFMQSSILDVTNVHVYVSCKCHPF
jgi:hypothetical protein